MKRTKDLSTNKGITLIALIITIMVMLILVGVTISMAVNGGLFSKAGEAVSTTNNALTAEGQLADGGIEVDGEWYNSIDEYLDSKNEVKKTLVELYKTGELKVGDYVDYNPAGVTSVNPDNPENAQGITAGTLTGYTTEAQNIVYEKLSWRVLGYDETNDKLLLISAAPTTGKLGLYGYVGYNNCEVVLKTVCDKLYSNSNIGATARNMTLEDIDTYLAEMPLDKELYGYGYRNEALRSRFQIDQSGNLSLVPDDGVVTLDLLCTAYSYLGRFVITEDTKLELLSSSKPEDGYWLVQRAVSVNEYGNSADWGASCVTDAIYVGRPILVHTLDASDPELCFLCSESLRLRPVVSLPSSVTTKDVPVK